MTEDRPAAPDQRDFTLDSREFYEAVCEPRDPSRWGPGLPSEPRSWGPAVIVEPFAPLPVAGEGGARRRSRGSRR